MAHNEFISSANLVSSRVETMPVRYTPFERRHSLNKTPTYRKNSSEKDTMQVPRTKKREVSTFKLPSFRGFKLSEIENGPKFESNTFFIPHKDEDEIKRYTEKFCTDISPKVGRKASSSYIPKISSKYIQQPCTFNFKTLDNRRTSNFNLGEKRHSLLTHMTTLENKNICEKEIKQIVNACTEFSIGTKQNMKLYTKTEGDIKSLFKNIQNKVIGVLINDEYKYQQHRQIHAKEV